MTSRLTPALLGITLGLLGVALPPSPAAAQDGPAGRFLKQRHEAVAAILRRQAPDARAQARQRDEVAALFSGLLDFEELSRRSLGTQWNTLSEAKRTEFVSLLRQLVERSYRRNVETTLNYVIRFGADEPGANSVVVRTVARSRRNAREPEIPIDYELRRASDGWRVVDVTTDSVSLVRNYRSQFTRIIARHGIDGLLERMRTRLANSDAP